MKKKIFYLSVLVFSLMFISSCTDNDPIYTATVPSEFNLTTSLDTIVLNETGGGTHEAIAFSWDSLVYDVSTPVIYTIQIDTLNGDFTAPLEESIITNSYALSYTDSVLNKKCLNLLKLTPDVENKVKVRIKANLAFGNMPVYSNVKILVITPFSVRKIVSFLYMPGDMTGWGDYTTKICSRNNDGKYEGYVNAAIWNKFKFTTDQSFTTGAVYGSVPVANSLYSLDASSSCWDIWFDAAGYFKINADLNTMTWSKTAVTSFCVTGDFNGWSLTANPMTYDAVNKVWTATCDITNLGWGLQIIGNGDWGYKFGVSDGGVNTGELNIGGSNMMPTNTGVRTVTMDLSRPEKYTFNIQ